MVICYTSHRKLYPPLYQLIPNAIPKVLDNKLKEKSLEFGAWIDL